MGNRNVARGIGAMIVEPATDSTEDLGGVGEVRVTDRVATVASRGGKNPPQADKPAGEKARARAAAR